MTKTIMTHTIDAAGQILGRLATKSADLLRGKHKIGFTYHQDHGDIVVILNAEKVVLSGKKATQKMYYRHSGHLGNLKEISFETMIKQKPEEVIRLAIRTMLPDNRLRDRWMKRLRVEKGNNDV